MSTCQCRRSTKHDALLTRLLLQPAARAGLRFLAAEYLRERGCDGRGRSLKILQPQALVRRMSVRFGERSRPRAIQHRGDPHSRIVTRVCVQRHAVLTDGYAEEMLAVTPQRLRQSLRAW